jgi:hypothetical protein
MAAGGLGAGRFTIESSGGGGTASVLWGTVGAITEVGGFVTSDYDFEGWSNVPANAALFQIGQTTKVAFKLGKGPQGLYYAEEWSPGARSIPSGAVSNICDAVTQLTLNKSYSDYGVAGAQMDNATGIWTCPDDGNYEVSYQLCYQNGVAPMRSALYVLRNPYSTVAPFLVQDIADQSGRGRVNASCTRFLAQNDTLKFQCLQGSGAAQLLQINDGCYIAIRRVL